MVSLLLPTLHRAAARGTTIVGRVLPALFPSPQATMASSSSSSSSSSSFPSKAVVAFSTSSSSSSSASASASVVVLPPIPTNKSRYATPQQIANAKERIINPSNPRSRRGNRPDGRNFPRYAGLPVNDDASSRNGIEMTTTPGGYKLYPSKSRYDTGVSPADMPFLHHRPDYRAPSDEEDDCGDDDSFSPSTTATGGRPKFRNPRKRASKLFHQLQTEAETESRLSKPEVWTVPFKVGDAIELGILDDGGAANPNNKKLDHVRGVVLGRENKGLDTSIYLKDVLYGEHVERKIKLHSPMVKTLKVLEEGFVNRGKKKGKRIKRAKLYYLRDLGLEVTRVTKVDR